MIRHVLLSIALPLLVMLAAAAPASAQTAERKAGEYPLTPDSLPRDGVPKGRLEGPFEFRSQVIAGTVRRYWVYVPAQYTGATPANVLVFQDGARAINPTGSLRVPQVLENLVTRRPSRSPSASSSRPVSEETYFPRASAPATRTTVRRSTTRSTTSTPAS